MQLTDEMREQAAKVVERVLMPIEPLLARHGMQLDREAIAKITTRDASGGEQGCS